jgi:hypothetical protein
MYNHADNRSMSEVSTTEPLECGFQRERRNRSSSKPTASLTQCNNLEGFLEHERQETEALAALNATLEVHRKAMDTLADTLAQVRRELFL